MWNPDGSGRHAPVNLSTASSSSSSALLTSIRAERQAREQQRVREHSATTIQRVWRGRHSAATTHEQILVSLEAGQATSVEQGARGILLLLSSPGQRDRVGHVLEQWCNAALVNDQHQRPAFTAAFDSPGYLYVLALVIARILRFVHASPRTALAGRLLASLEMLLAPGAYTLLNAADRESFVAVLAHQRWVETLDSTLQVLAAANLPKKKHPLLLPVVRLVTAPLALSSPTTIGSPFVSPLIQFLAIPSLLSVIPLASLTHLSSTLPLFPVLLPAAGAKPSMLSEGRLADDLGSAAFLANLATFGITGGMLARHGARGAADWIRVVGTVMGQLGEGWGRLAENRKVEEQIELSASDTDDEIAPNRPRAATIVLPPSVGSKLLLLTTPTHLSTLAGFVVNGSTGLLQDYSMFVLGILHAFRGSPRWEGTLDAVMDGKRGRALVKQLWRQGIRGRWSSSRDAWDTFSTNSIRHALLFLSQIYCHYLLLTPDDEFFDPQVNPLTVDEVLDLSSIWRDLAYWGYMNGVTNGTTSTLGTEEQRSLFTRGVTRVSERNARRKFAPDEFWIMQTLAAQADAKGFVEAVKFEAAEFDNDAQQSTELRWGSRYTSRRQLAYISPRLGLLNNLPMAVPFKTRLEVFRSFITADRERLGISNRYSRRSTNSATIRRSDLAHDGFRQLNDLGPMLKGTLHIHFVDQFGLEEAGIDGGGLFKEFLTSLSKEAFDTERGLWLTNYNNELYPNPHSYATEPHQLEWYGFIGRVLGKALYEDILVDVKFAGFFLAKWLGRQSYLDDLASLDRDLYRGLIMLKNYPGDPEDLSLNFTITEDDFGVARSIDLVPGGSDIAVTAENRHEYIQLVCKYKLDRQFAQQSRAFFSGLSDLIDPKWLRMFDQTELAQLLGGEQTPIDLVDLREHTSIHGYDDGYTPQLFWRVVAGFTQEQQRALLRFVTSCSRPPLLGFKHLNPGFAIRNGGHDKERLPTASSCVNLLKLPDYRDEAVLRQKLLQAITSGAGFDMS